ncbi:MAG: M48 family metallopeptidase [Chloroflexi bacterium]|nr:M48 family metallopeptidase [Chloroflexota bacterium]
MEIRVERSVRRQRTVSARFEHGILVIRIPASLTLEEEQRWIHRVQQRLTPLHTPGADDRELSDRATKLAQRYLPVHLPSFQIRYVNNQQWRWGSCSPQTGEIRLSHRLAQLPEWVRDYVIIHELVHLIYPNHSNQFWRLVARYPLAERARGFLIALDAIEHNPHSLAGTSSEEHLERTSNTMLTKE